MKEKDRVLYNPEMRRLAKLANQRIRELERKQPNAPALRAVQASLEQMGRRGTGQTGRRFSETGKATVTQMHAIMKELDRFINYKTSTATGAKELKEEVWNSADGKYNLSSRGVSKDDYYDIWQDMPNKEKDRILSSDVIIEIVGTVLMKERELKEAINKETDLEKRRELEKEYENRVPVRDLVAAIKDKADIKSAYNTAGITYKDVNRFKKLGDVE